MPRVDPADWIPRDVASLENAAEVVVRSNTNMLVVAGPGAGKTELLAQRACFLLETGTCPPPRRILAISFKRDAAKNLAERVRARCGDRARRFDSLTLDAFGKGLVDRFRCALVPEWRPKQGYEVMVKFPRTVELRDWFESVPPSDGQQVPNFKAITDSKIRLNFERCAFGCRLPYDEEGIHPLLHHYGLQWWKTTLSAPVGHPSLSFPMLNRLAAFLLRQNPKLLAALRATYAFVFMDEFQDTTAAQYDVVQAAFLSSDSILTAVGDSKQRIMVWAGAMEDAFERIEQDFAAVREHLIRNYRSAPELVRIQQYIAETIESEAPQAHAVKAPDGNAACSVFEFSTPESEAEHLAELVSREIVAEGLKPRDFCVLVRQQTSSMVEILRRALGARNVRLRDESSLQDLLTEPVTEIILSILRLATRDRDPEAWEFLVYELGRLRGLDPGSLGSRVGAEAKGLLTWTKNTLNDPHLDAKQLPAAILAKIGEQDIRVSYRQYSGGNFLASVVTQLGDVLASNAPLGIKAAVDDIIGTDIVPAMTVHKSKGLEFHTVVFLGLEDSQLWNFANQTQEEIRGFFVAFSRAIHRVIFTFSDVRDGRFGRRSQEKTIIKDLYTILQSAGVETVDLRTRPGNS